MSGGNAKTALTVVVVSFNAPPIVERCLAALVEQGLAPDVEIVVVRATGVGDAGTEALRRRFSQCRWITPPSGDTIPRMRCRGMAVARGDIVALIEDDCVIDDVWYTAVMSAHREPWVAVGGAVEPGAYARALDWAVYLYEYGRFMLPFESRPSAILPGNNVSYKRNTLASEILGRTTEFHDVFVHASWASNGLPMLITPTLVVTNRNSWPITYATVSPFHHGRAFAAMRMAAHSWWRRGAHAILAPFLPILQILRIFRLTVVKRRNVGRSFVALPWLFIFGGSWAIGEAVGALFGAGRSAEHWR